MSNEEKVSEFFQKVHSVMDAVYDTALGILDEAFVKVDEFVDQWEKNTKENMAGTTQKGEEVKVAPDVETMREDIIRNREKAYGPLTRARTIFKSANENVVRMYWDGLPDKDKSWVKRDKNSPL